MERMFAPEIVFIGSWLLENGHGQSDKRGERQCVQQRGVVRSQRGNRCWVSGEDELSLVVSRIYFRGHSVQHRMSGVSICNKDRAHRCI